MEMIFFTETDNHEAPCQRQSHMHNSAACGKTLLPLIAMCFIQNVRGCE